MKVNDYVMLCTEKETRVVRAASKGTLNVARRVKFPAKSLIGVKYGSVMELRGRDVVVVNEGLMPDLSKWLGEDFASVEETGENDNRDLVANNENQGLSAAEITKMKRNGATASDIIDALIKNSSTYASKTVFSKAKYLKRKLKKFLHRFRVERSRPENMLNNQYTKNKHKICSLRWDSMAKILSFSNLAYGTNAMVYDLTKGLVASSMAYRMQGNGRVFSVHKKGKRNNLEHQFNFSNKIKNSISHVTLDMIQGLEEKRKSKVELSSVEKDLLGGMDSLAIIVDGAKDDPWDVFKTLIPFVKPSSPIVIFTPYIEPLTKCYNMMLKEYTYRIAIDVKLTDSFTREIQVLNMRTHPQMMMDASSGFLLTGIRVYNEALDNKVDEVEEDVVKVEVVDVVEAKTTTTTTTATLKRPREEDTEKDPEIKEEEEEVVVKRAKIDDAPSS